MLLFRFSTKCMIMRGLKSKESHTFIKTVVYTLLSSDYYRQTLTHCWLNLVNIGKQTNNSSFQCYIQRYNNSLLVSKLVQISLWSRTNPVSMAWHQSMLHDLIQSACKNEIILQLYFKDHCKNIVTRLFINYTVRLYSFI